MSLIRRSFGVYGRIFDTGKTSSCCQTCVHLAAVVLLVSQSLAGESSDHDPINTIAQNMKCLTLTTFHLFEPFSPFRPCEIDSVLGVVAYQLTKHGTVFRYAKRVLEAFAILTLAKCGELCHGAYLCTCFNFSEAGDDIFTLKTTLREERGSQGVHDIHSFRSKGNRIVTKKTRLRLSIGSFPL